MDAACVRGAAGSSVCGRSEGLRLAMMLLAIRSASTRFRIAVRIIAAQMMQAMTRAACISA